MKPTLIGSLGLAMALACGVAQAEKKKPTRTPTPAPAPAVPPAPPAPAAVARAGEGEVASEVVSEPVPPQVLAAASAAVAKLGDEVVLAHYQVAVERMYPPWKERAAKRMGGMDALEKQLAGVGAQMVQMGISMISFKPQGNPRAYEVAPDTREVKENGVSVKKLVFTKWLVLVPTIRKIRIMREGNPKPVVIESSGYQVAIADKGKDNWTFIDGAGLKPSDLRGLFGTLPQNLELPPVEEHEAH